MIHSVKSISNIQMIDNEKELMIKTGISEFVEKMKNQNIAFDDMDIKIRFYQYPFVESGHTYENIVRLDLIINGE